MLIKEIKNLNKMMYYSPTMSGKWVLIFRLYTGTTFLSAILVI